MGMLTGNLEKIAEHGRRADNTASILGDRRVDYLGANYP
jgi:hypothetical protein